MRYDVMIIGGGPGGYTAAHKAAKNGLSVLLFEKDKIGGTCLNRGCIPTKALIEASRLYRDAKEGEVLGITGDVGFDFELVNARRDEIVEKLRSGVEKMLKADKVEVINGEAKIVAKDQIECAGRIYEGENIIIASGSVTSIPPIEGIEEAITSDTILEEAFDLPESMIIIGGGVIGSEIADALNGFGSKITIIEMADRLIPTMDKDLGQRLGMFFKKKGIDVFLNAAVKKIEKTAEGKKVLYSDKNGKECEVCAKEVLVATGRRAAVQGLVKEGLDLKIERGVTADATGKTNIDNIYVIGDAKAGNIQLAHVASAQGENVIDTILKQKEKIDLSVVPSGIYTSTEIASVGTGEDKLKADGVNYQAKKVLTGANGRCLIENSESGFVKVLCVDDVIVGASIVAPHATELISELALAVQKKMSLKEVEEVIHPHPTVSEMIWEATK